jgi:hypothetical protein
MDPLTLSGTFATIVGLLTAYKSERSGATLTEFMDWLRAQHHDQIIAKIEADNRLSSELKLVLAMKHEDLLLKLSAITSQISYVAQQIDGISSLARYLGPPTPLSTQAESILRQLVNSGAQHAQELSISSNNKFIFIGGTRAGELEFEEPRFAAEDIEALSTTGLIRIEYTSKHARKLLPTRLGFDYVRKHDA